MIWQDDAGLLSAIKNEQRYGVFLYMGAGKTSLLLALVDHKFFAEDVRKVLIIAPKKVSMATWQNEIKKFRNFHYLSTVVREISGTESKREKALKASADAEFSIDIISSSLIEWLVHARVSPGYDLVIVDECSQFKSATSKRTKSLMELSKNSQLFLLSGTPFSNVEAEYRKNKLVAYKKADELYYLLYFLEIYQKSIYEFRRDFCFTNPWEKYTIRMKPVVYDVLIEAIHERSITKEPTENIKVKEHTIICPVDQFRMKQLQDDYIFLTDGLLNITAKNKAIMINKALQLSNGFIYDHNMGRTVRVNEFKFNELKRLLDKIGKQVVIFYVFKEDKEYILKNIKGSKLYDSDKDRIAWENGEIDYLVLSPFSDKYGLNLQMGGHKIIWFGLVWSAESYEQANKRIARRGQMFDVDIYYLIGESGFDHYVYEKLVRKIETKDSFMGCFRQKEKPEKAKSAHDV
jgi:hypothetical protein